MKKNLLFSLAAVLILCVGIYIGTTFNNQKNTSDSTSEKEVAPEEIEYSDNKVVSEESEDSTQSIEYMTQEDKAWLFQQVYDGMHTTTQDSDEAYFIIELKELPSLANTASRDFFNNRKAPDTLEDEYKAWRAEKYGNKGSTNSTISKTDTTNKVTETQKPAQTPNQQKPTQSQSQQKPAQNNSGQPNAGEVMTTNPFADQDRTRTPEQEQKDIENTRKNVENDHSTLHAGSGN